MDPTRTYTVDWWLLQSNDSIKDTLIDRLDNGHPVYLGSSATELTHAICVTGYRGYDHDTGIVMFNDSSGLLSTNFTGLRCVRVECTWKQFFETLDKDWTPSDGFLVYDDSDETGWCAGKPVTVDLCPTHSMTRAVLSTRPGLASQSGAVTDSTLKLDWNRHEARKSLV